MFIVDVSFERHTTRCCISLSVHNDVVSLILIFADF